MEQVYRGVNRSKYDITQRSARWAIERDKQIDEFNIGLVMAGLDCCKPKGAGCDCETKGVGETFMPLGLEVQNDDFAQFK
jgi:hypothetical protein